MVNKYNLLFLIKLSNGTAHEFTRTSLQDSLENAIAEAAKLEAAFELDNIELVLHSILSEQRELLWTKESRKTFLLNFTVYKGRKTVSDKVTIKVEAESVEQARAAATQLANNLHCDSLNILYELTSILEKETQEVVWNIYWEHPEKPVEKFNPNTYWEHSERLLRKAPLKDQKK